MGRDLEGWRVPQQGSKSRLIYDWLKYGATTLQIARKFGFDVELTRSLAYKLTHPEWANYNKRMRRSRDQLEARLPRIIYGLLKYGLGTHEIATLTGFTPGVVRVLAHKMRPPNWREVTGPRQAQRELAELSNV